MPTKHERIAVVRDGDLHSALERIAPLVAPGTRPATLVHDLAIRGAEALLAEHDRRQAALRDLADRSVQPDPGFDREVLARIDELAWTRG
jgi:hypothetical protein